jgi:hypothetical protein
MYTDFESECTMHYHMHIMYTVNTHLIAQAKDALTISEDNSFDVFLRPVVQYITYIASVPQ